MSKPHLGALPTFAAVGARTRARNEFEAVVTEHEFIRPFDAAAASHTSASATSTLAAGADDDWANRAARKFEEQLHKEYALVAFREVAVASGHGSLPVAGVTSRMEAARAAAPGAEAQPGMKRVVVGMRWRTPAEVRAGKGEVVCGCVDCDRVVGLHSFEVPFAYVEKGVHKKALVKARLCGLCAEKLLAAREADEQTSSRKVGSATTMRASAAADGFNQGGAAVDTMHGGERARRSKSPSPAHADAYGTCDFRTRAAAGTTRATAAPDLSGDDYAPPWRRKQGKDIATDAWRMPGHDGNRPADASSRDAR